MVKIVTFVQDQVAAVLQSDMRRVHQINEPAWRGYDQFASRFEVQALRTVFGSTVENSASNT